MMKRALYIIWQIVWGLPQSFVGAIVFLATRPKRYGMFKGAVVSTWPKTSSISLGLFVFIAENAVGSSDDLGNPQCPALRRLIAHEYGHTIQSLVLGPLYLIVIGLPSVLWANFPALRRKRKRSSISYYRFYTERNANWLSRRFLNLDVPE